MADCNNSEAPEDPRYQLICGEISTEASSTQCPIVMCRERDARQFHNFGSGVGTQVGFEGSGFLNQGLLNPEQVPFPEWIKTSTVAPNILIPGCMCTPNN